MDNTYNQTLLPVDGESVSPDTTIHLDLGADGSEIQAKTSFLTKHKLIIMVILILLGIVSTAVFAQNGLLSKFTEKTNTATTNPQATSYTDNKILNPSTSPQVTILQPTNTPPIQKASPTSKPVATSISVTPKATVTSTPRVPHPPQVNIYHPAIGEQFNLNGGGYFTLNDQFSGNSSQGIKRKYKLNSAQWTAYIDANQPDKLYPSEGDNLLQVRYINSDGDESEIYSIQFKNHFLQVIDITVNGEIYEDKNCNNIKDADETNTNAPATVHVISLPEYSIVKTITSDNSGRYSTTLQILETESKTLTSSIVAPSGYKIVHDNTNQSLFDKTNRSFNFISNITSIPDFNTCQL